MESMRPGKRIDSAKNEAGLFPAQHEAREVGGVEAFDAGAGLAIVVVGNAEA